MGSESRSLPVEMVVLPRPQGIGQVLEKVGARLRQFYGGRFALVEPVQHTDIERQVILAALQCLEAALSAPPSSAPIGEVLGHESPGHALVQWSDNGLRPIGTKVYAAPSEKREPEPYHIYKTCKYTDAILDAPRYLIAYAETPGRTTQGAREHLERCGVEYKHCWPDWAYESGHLTKSGLAELIHRMMEAARAANR